MGKTVFLLFDLVICAVEGYLYYSFWSYFLQKRNREIWKDVGIMTGGMSILFCINYNQLTKLNLAASGLISFSLCMILFKDKWSKKVYAWITGWFVMACCEFIIVMGLCLTLGDQTIVVTGTPNQVILSTIMMKLLTLFVYRLICSKSRAGKTEPYPPIISLFFCLPIASLIICVALCYLGDSLNLVLSDNMLLMFGCICLLASNVVTFIIGDLLICQMNKAKNYELTETKRRLEEIHFKSVNDRDERVKAILHDMNGVMQTLDVLMKHCDVEQIKQVMTGLQKKLSETGHMIYCGNPLIDAILSEKAKDAEKQNIIYQVFIEQGFTMIEMEPIDLISLVTNLTDNAIEASSKCNNGFVDIKMFQASDGDIVIMKFKNNYEESPVEYNGEFQTKKEKASMHGIGVRQIKQLVKQYNGYINIDYGNHIFEATISFSRK